VALTALKNLNLQDAALNWLDERFAVRAIAEFAGHKEVPVHKHSIWYYMGGIAMVFVMVQIITGLLLMVYYVPTFEGAYESVRVINQEVAFGWLIRSLHSWGANLFLLVLFVHMFSTYFMKAYRAPREFTWLSGLGLLGLAMVFGFTGYMLPMDEIAYFATQVGLSVAVSSPGIPPIDIGSFHFPGFEPGAMIAGLLTGNVIPADHTIAISQSTMSRFFLIHIMALPAALLGLLGFHLMLIQLQGISEPEFVQALPKAERKYEKFFPEFVLKDLLVWFLVITLLVVFVCMSPWGLGPQADTSAPAPLGIHPEWYFMSQFIVLKMFPAEVGPLNGEHIAMGVIGALVGSLVIVPLLDTGKSKLMSQFATVYGWVFLAGFIVLTMWEFGIYQTLHSWGIL
jgi:quinol-cytochrome oxidoreductase complex cytochrome b subunit